MTRLRRRDKWTPWPEVNDSRLLTPLRVRRSLRVSHAGRPSRCIFHRRNSTMRPILSQLAIFPAPSVPPASPRAIIRSSTAIKHLEYDLFFSKINVTTERTCSPLDRASPAFSLAKQRRRRINAPVLFSPVNNVKMRAAFCRL